MRLYVPDMAEMFSWLDQAGHRYAVLRGFAGLENGYPPPGSKQDVDLLVDDAALAPLHARYGQYKKRQGVKCDFYDVNGKGEGAYLGFSYLPPALAEQVLAERRLWKNKFYVPGAKAQLLSLLYHITYQKSERSKMDYADPAKSRESKYVAELEGLKKELGVDLPLTLSAFHAYLKKAGYGLARERLIRYLQNDFERACKHQHKSFLLASVCAEAQGEMNMFVIRAIAMKKGVQDHLLQELRKHYTLLTVKPIPWLTRLTKRAYMRGGKWKRGGMPHLAVLVFDPASIPTTEADGKVHPFVFNARQFFKPRLREWFTQTTGAKASANPIHSTDNEAEAIGHLPLFFSDAEQQDIFRRVDELRAELAQPADQKRRQTL